MTLVTDTFEIDGTRTPVGTHIWFDWVDSPDTRSFRFDDGTDSFTARKEKIRGTDGYWYAYRKVNGKLHKRYLGRSADLLPGRLIEVGGLLGKPPNEPIERLPKPVGNSEGLSEARETIRELQEELQGLHTQLGNLQRENEELRSQPSTPGLRLPEAATLLNQLKARRKKSTATLLDVEVLIELLLESEDSC